MLNKSPITGPFFFIFFAQAVTLFATSETGKNDDLEVQPNALSCPQVLVNGEGTRALLAAPAELRTKIWQHWEAMFRKPTVGWSLRSFDVLYALEGNTERLRQIVSEVIRSYIHSSPLRHNTKLLGQWTSMLALPAPLAPLEASTPHRFVFKYGLQNYKRVSDRVLQEILPPEFSRASRSSAGFSYGFRPYPGTELFRAAGQLGLAEEQAALKMLLIIHEAYEQLGEVLEITGDDEAFYQVGLYALSDFYLADLHRFYYNKLWDAIELMKRARDPQIRAKIRAVFIDLAYDLLSDDFKAELAANTSDAEDFNAFMKVLLSNMLRGLKSIGEDILFIEREDSIKKSYTTRSSDLQLRAAIRAVISAQADLNERTKMDEWFEAYQVTNDLEGIEQLLPITKDRDSFLEVLSLISLNQIEEALKRFKAILEENNTGDRLGEYRLSQFAHRLPLVPYAMEFRQGLSAEQRLQLQTAHEQHRRDRVPVQAPMHHVSSVDSIYNWNRSDGYQESMKRALEFEAAGDNLNAGSAYMEAAFDLYRATPRISE